MAKRHRKGVRPDGDLIINWCGSCRGGEIEMTPSFPAFVHVPLNKEKSELGNSGGSQAMGNIMRSCLDVWNFRGSCDIQTL